MKVLVVLGTRPEVIKLAPVIEALRPVADTVVCATGQHREMLAQALDSFGILPDVTLDTMSPGRSLNVLASRLLAEMDGVLEREQPDWVVVQGDTTTAYCAGLAAFHRGVAVAHVEAGLRTADLANPFPEEANRRLLGQIVSRHFAPTQRARENLLREGIDDAQIVITGNTVVDAILLARRAWEQVPASLARAGWHGGEPPHILVTCHRRENFGETLISICKMLRDLCARYAGHRWVFPVHLNPAVREPVMRELGAVPNLVLMDPVDYEASLYLISRSLLVLSDSGGIQEEAPTFGVPVVVMRSHTERREGVDAGFATLAGQTPECIEAAASAWLDDPARREALRNRANPYGDGRAAQRIVASLAGQRAEVLSD
ncbi:UDP-N-acetylglucosamine 2-epimerase (non-hydrolyzing) [Paraburkholderia sp. CNPSo 3076]|uniref:non-hydrolyzing UDP-N-acetylglucosamine 2-epimerase n=1 Tax=Paraburkholderia sp. CNPSo 3076 TaxID=2940936 RepID=UPI00224E99B0|nr:UDP-N-acetylglucosamine 2-epimerase (non-hydrolyzing) [Paraburkholderia sp. CNPSo 3076]MCX5539969.1 UDP-N-acetylglucosamine 2-epimerase (non-hydrolyzing) [Paraburkholderia sp. CNPSo 3076]